MPTENFTQLIDEIGLRSKMVKSYLAAPQNRITFAYKHLEDAVYSYVNAGGKSLRPAVLMFCCGAVGGDEQIAVPAAAAVELYHTFTLVHDDIIDRDEMRRSVPTVHYDFARRARAELHMDDATAAHYGLAIAILAGDMQQGWAASLLPDLHFQHGLPAELALVLVRELFRQVQITLINGETVDILQAETPVERLDEKQVLDMLWQKTGSLYAFAGRAGAAIGLRLHNLEHPIVTAVGKFTGECGIAFQIQDDVLGIIGDETRLGKPVGSDIREGKRTIIVLHSLPLMSAAERQFTLDTLGNHEATDEQIAEVVGLLHQTGGIRHAQNLARHYVEEALEHLRILDDSPYKTLLTAWADYIIQRDL